MSKEIFYLVSKEPDFNEEGKVSAMYAEGFAIGALSEDNKKVKIYERFKNVKGKMNKDSANADAGELYLINMNNMGEIVLRDAVFSDRDKEEMKVLNRVLKVYDDIKEVEADHIYDPSVGLMMRFEDAPLVTCRKCRSVTYENLIDENGNCEDCR